LLSKILRGTQQMRKTGFKTKWQRLDLNLLSLNLSSFSFELARDDNRESGENQYANVSTSLGAKA